MLRYLGYEKEAHRIEKAVDVVLLEGNTLTPDLGGKSTTDEVTHAIIQLI